MMKKPDRNTTSQIVANRRDEALRVALNTPPKQHKDMKKGKEKKRQVDHPTASSEKRT
jgi:hypothetical protein